MRRKLLLLGETRIPYFVKGDSPTLLIHSGTHGDECGVVDSVRKAVEKYETGLPDFIYVPLVSPSAVAKKTRENGDGVDINRNFLENSRLAEVEANFAIVRNRQFNLFVSFHEDPYWKSIFYLYDVNTGVAGSEAWRSYKEEIKSLGLRLLNGSDDAHDPALNHTFKEGYCYFAIPPEGESGGSFDAWMIRNGVGKKILIPEIPGKLAPGKKDRLVDLFFRYFLFKT